MTSIHIQIVTILQIVSIGYILSHCDKPDERVVYVTIMIQLNSINIRFISSVLHHLWRFLYEENIYQDT